MVAHDRRRRRNAKATRGRTSLTTNRQVFSGSGAASHLCIWHDKVKSVQRTDDPADAARINRHFLTQTSFCRRNDLSSERSRKRVVCAALCASWFKNMATGIDWTGRRAQATRAQTTTDVQIGLPRPTDIATVQYFVQLPPIMFGFSESADIGLSF